MWKKLESEKIVIVFFLFVIGLGINSFFWYKINLSSKKALINLTLSHAAENVKNLLPKGFHNNNMKKNDYRFNELYTIFTGMDIEAKKMEVDYIYTFIKKDGRIYYASLSGNDEEVREDSDAFYLYPLDKAKDDSYTLLNDIFNNPRIEFLDSKDRWNEYKSVYMPQIAEDGMLFVAGADIIKKNFYGQINSILYLMLISLGSILLLSVLVVMVFRTYKKKNDRGILDLIEYDKFTGVYKREVGFKFIENQIMLYEKHNIDFSIFIVDINGLQEVNSREGLKNGDILIKVLANLLKKNVWNGSKVFRLNDDDFIVINSHCNEESENQFLNELMHKVKYFNQHNKKNLYLRLHVAVVKYENQGLDSFIEAAVGKLNEAKKRGDYHEASIQYQIKEGLKNKEFIVYYQPKVNVMNNKISFEALIRWRNSSGVIISPDEFIPIAEKSYLIFLLTEFVLEEVIKNIERYNMRISINISPIILEKSSFLKHIFDRINNFNLKGNLTLEITEGVALRNLENTIEKIKRFNEIGVNFSMDDFGTGYSSLSNLNLLPMSEVKIDKSFVQMIEERPENRVIIEMIVRLGDVLGFEIVAEGVETIEHLIILKKLGCHIFQGFYFDKPIPINEVVKKLENDSYIKRLD